MFEFKWRLPGETEREVVLRVHGRQGWFGRKEVICDARTILRRGYFEGINADLPISTAQSLVRLKLVNTRGRTDWRPALFAGGQEVPELTSTAPPHVPVRPKLLANVTGLTYLLMFMVLIMAPSFQKILTAVRLPHDQRSFVLTVQDSEVFPDTLAYVPTELPPATRGEPYTAELKATGGTPPYKWLASKKGWPKSMILDETTGIVSFTPKSRYDPIGAFEVVDANGLRAPGAFAIEVRSPEASEKNRPSIAAPRLPPAFADEPYEVDIPIAGGQPPYSWKLLTGRLPQGLKLDSGSGRITGRPSGEYLCDLVTVEPAPIAAGNVPESVRLAFGISGHELSPEAEVAPHLSGDGWRIRDTAGTFDVKKKSGDGLAVFGRVGHFPLTIYASDGSYDASQDLFPWGIPIVVTSVCLLGYWNMRRWSVYLFAPLIVAQAVAGLLVLVPIATMALMLQAGLWLVGFVYVGKMQ